MFIKSAIEVDAISDPVRSTAYLGSWYLASLLKEKGHKVRFIDEVFRDGGLQKRKLFERTIVGDKFTEQPIEDKTYRDVQVQKMDDFRNLSEHDFVDKYSPYREEGKITRTMARIGNPLEETLAEVGRTQPDVVAIPLIATANYLPAVELGKAIKDRWPEIKVIYGGQHISAKADEFVKENPWVDHIVLGDALEVIEPVVNGEISDKIVHSIYGPEGIEGPLNERKQKYRGAHEPLSTGLEKFPLLDPEIIAENDYPNETTYTYSTEGRKSVDFMTSKGCFKRCDFCVAGQLAKKKITPVTTIDEETMDRQLKIFKDAGYDELVIQDDAFLMPREEKDFPGYDPNKLRVPRLKQVFSVMKKYGFHMQINGGLDFELLNDEVTNEFIKYNKEGEGKITAMYIPLNPRNWVHGRSATKTMIEKHPDAYENLKRLREEAGIYVYTTDIIGDPEKEQTVETMKNDLDLHKRMLREGYVDQVLTLSATMLPGTDWEKKFGEGVINPKDYAGYSLFTTHHRTKDVHDPKLLEEMMIHRNKELNELQKSFPWGTAFPNEGMPGEVKHELKSEATRSLEPPSEIGRSHRR